MGASNLSIESFAESLKGADAHGLPSRLFAHNHVIYSANPMPYFFIAKHHCAPTPENWTTTRDKSSY